jgi:hypothetical protein
MVDQRLRAIPGVTLQVMVTERVIEQFGLIEPGGMDRCEAHPPPGMAFEVLGGGGGGMAGIAVLDQKHTAQVAMVVTKLLQRLDVMGGVFLRRAESLHPTAMHDQKQQHVDGPMARVLKFLLFDRARNGAADRGALNGLKIGHLIDADDPNPASNQTLSVSVTPENFLRALFEQRVQAGCFPVPCAMRLQVHVMQNASHSACAQVGNNTLEHRLPSQVLARPMGNMQSLSDRRQTRQLHDLGTLQGGKSHPDDLSAACQRISRQARRVHSDGRCARWSTVHIASGRRRFGRVRPRPWPIPREPAGPETTVRSGFARPGEEVRHRDWRA